MTSEAASRTGRGVRVAIVDSGVHARHPHVGGVAGGVGIEDEGRLSNDFLDRLGDLDRFIGGNGSGGNDTDERRPHRD